jgi:hypothetical protein
MGQVYRQGYDENGNVINPAFFTDGMSDLAGAFNSSLDRDNFAQNDIILADIDGDVGDAFLFLSSQKTDTSFSPNMEATEWQGGEGNDASGINYITWTATQDSHYEFHFSVSWSWNGSYSWVSAGTRPDRTDTFDTIMLRASIDGVTLSVAGPFEDGDVRWSTYMVGATQLPAGPHTFKIECQVVRRVAQSLQVDSACLNDCTINSRACVIMGRFR